MSAPPVAEPIVGRTDRLEPDGTCWYRNEFEIRDALAATGWLAGWDVQTEVPVSTGGRADVVMVAPDGYTVVIEVKLELVTLRQCRLAFQQADGYRKHFEQATAGPCMTLLVAPKIDRATADTVAGLYPEISYQWPFATIQSLRGEMTQAFGVEMLRKAHARNAQAQHHAAVAERTFIDSVRFVQGYGLTKHFGNYPATVDMLMKAIAS